MLTICAIIYLLRIPGNLSIQTNLLDSGNYVTQFGIVHWITAILTAVIIYKLIVLNKLNEGFNQKSITNITWSICAFITIFLSVEFYILANTMFHSDVTAQSDISRVYIKTVLPILWGVLSFIYMWLGMKYKFKSLRIISLSLFTLTLLKLFIFDIRNIPVAGKIAAFFCLGVLLLVVSFMYQRLKEIIVDDEKKPII